MPITDGRLQVRRVRVLVVEDSATVRARIVATLRADPGIEVVAEARDGETAIELCLTLRPDVVTMDMMLPGISGLVAVQQLMRRCPTPILVISAPGNRAGFIDTLAALAAGAVDVLDKPDATTLGNQAWDRHLLSTVKLVAKIRVITHFASTADSAVPPVPHCNVPSQKHPAEHLNQLSQPNSFSQPNPFSQPNAFSQPNPFSQAASAGRYALVALGASTGGPTAVATVLRDLPRTFALPVLLVLHVSESFGTAFASWLQDVTERTVRLAAHGEPLESGAGQVIMAPPGQHLEVSHGLLMLNRGPERHSCRPSVDVLFESLAREAGPRVAAVLLTGMGKDGASGLLDVQRSGGLTIAQDEATSAVFGMPGEAVRLGAADYVLPIEAIGPALARLTMTPVEQP